MTDRTTSERTSPETELGFFRRRLEVMARGRHRDELEDLAIEAWIRLDRFRQHEEARNLEALMTRIARFVWIDFVRKKARAGESPASLDESEIQVAAPAQDSGVDPEALAIFRFAALEYFSRSAPRCHELGRFYFSGLNWFQVAEKLGEKRDAIAKRWQRCVEHLVAAGRKDPGAFGAALHQLEGFAS